MLRLLSHCSLLRLTSEHLTLRHCASAFSEVSEILEKSLLAPDAQLPVGREGGNDTVTRLGRTVTSMTVTGTVMPCLSR